MKAKNLAVLGLQWGDEGKGKIVNFLADRTNAACRYQGGHNAGHTLIVNGKKPSIIHQYDRNLLLKDIIEKWHS